ncbi:PP2C family protein-serine/threonine phosphatase [Streptomyces longwoodensis]|uniref:PP2C family protein-serine/threonine phosphatase n=1 Tax=Streptomyces longwoodensis TaxID=68231 RepID=UPI002DDA6908|nr:PP2C family protein-serine/threonine phosphatase [Streptomyces longwoodensis]WRY89513.1 serine/threonine-protein phosphatase [Streptomyces longwoodensis]WTI46192.1 serine/threonine-protein phosphatase [Streptomyces longwoodensis]WUC59001.1 serine/threonine-protein phosphatase [Streptomyces longwoodensis]WUC72503.1 serine/threonine-protein phosphatase [Streptomyces longwoodensis]
MLDIPSRVRVHVETLLAAQNHMGVCDAFEQYAPVREPDAMNAPHPPKVAGIDSTVPSPAHTVAPAPAAPEAPPVAAAPTVPTAPCAPGALLQDRLAGWVSDLTTLHELTERLARTNVLDDALQELLRAGAALVGAQRGLVALEPADGLGPDTTLGLGLGRADLGHLETVPRNALPFGRILDGLPGGEDGVAEPDLSAEDGLDPRHREVAARLGYAASYALPLAGETTGRLGAAVWLYDEPAEPDERRRHLVGLYVRHAAEHLARLREVERTRACMRTIAEELLPSRLPRVAGVQLAARHRTGPHGGGDWYDALPLPDAALGLSVGAVTGSGPSAVAAMGRLRASLRAYAVMEGEDPVAVLSDLELLLRLTEPARSATALFAYCEPALRKVTLAGAGHCPPLLTGVRRTEFVETSVSAPLGMLACWEAPSVELEAEAGETVLLYTDGLLHRTGETTDRAFARLHAAAAGVPRALRQDPGAVADHVLRTVLPDGLDAQDGAEDVVVLAARFE